jgi:hypothetical protein
MEPLLCVMQHTIKCTGMPYREASLFLHLYRTAWNVSLMLIHVNETPAFNDKGRNRISTIFIAQRSKYRHWVDAYPFFWIHQKQVVDNFLLLTQRHEIIPFVTDKSKTYIFTPMVTRPIVMHEQKNKQNDHQLQTYFPTVSFTVQNVTHVPAIYKAVVRHTHKCRRENKSCLYKALIFIGRMKPQSHIHWDLTVLLIIIALLNKIFVLYFYAGLWWWPYKKPKHVARFGPKNDTVWYYTIGLLGPRQLLFSEWFSNTGLLTMCVAVLNFVVGKHHLTEARAWQPYTACRCRRE